MMRVPSVFLAVALLAGCQTTPKTAPEVAARTEVISGDGFGRTAKSSIGPDIALGGNKLSTVYGHFASNGSTDVWLHCHMVSSDAMKDANFMRTVYTSDGAKLVLLTRQDDIALRLANGVERFTIVIPADLIRAKRATGLKFKVYGTRTEIEMEIPAWYLDGFLTKVEP